MRCDTYKNALLERAAAAEELTGRVKDHVEECPQCRATLRREQMLLAMIDRALHARMEETPRVGFLPNVRARISQEPEPGSAIHPMWMLAAATVMVTLLALAVPWARLRRQPLAVGSPAVSTIRVQAEPKIAEPGTAGTAHGRNQTIKKQAVARNTHREPEVLVPPDERVALATFVTHLRQRDEVARAFASPRADDNDALAEITPVEIARLQVKPLIWESWK
jgi:hypothetical protein